MSDLTPPSAVAAIPRPAAPAPAAVGPTAEAARRASRRRTMIILASISVGWKVLVFTVGAVLPRWLVADGVQELDAAQRSYGAAAIVTAGALFDTPIERYGRVVQRLRVVSVDRVPDAAGCAIGARVRAYTYFAIPYSEVRTRCGGGAIEYRVFRPKARVE